VGAVLPAITAEMAEWLQAQPLFFVATAPLGPDGHVNVSPKGYDALRVLDERTVAYLDLTGSGAETVAHLRENGRITLMWCAFEGKGRIVRISGRGQVHEPGSPRYEELAVRFPALPGARAVIEVRAERISTSCGDGVPLMDFVGHRERLLDWARAKGEDGLRDYRAAKNAVSIDGLPAL
jgi:hypothetical protein